jgi:hypothetical protein
VNIKCYTRWLNCLQIPEFIAGDIINSYCKILLSNNTLRQEESGFFSEFPFVPLQKTELAGTQKGQGYPTNSSKARDQKKKKKKKRG